jgi:hypothetical protein
MENAASVCNAMIHKYLFVLDMLDQNRFKYLQFQVKLAMVLLQIIWPVFAALFLLRIDMQPDKEVKVAKLVSYLRCW